MGYKLLNIMLRSPKTQQLKKVQAQDVNLQREIKDDFGVSLKGVIKGHVVDAWDDLVAHGNRVKSWKKRTRRVRQYKPK